MSTFFNERYAGIVPYVPGEQPHDRPYVKLNANETSVPAAPGVRSALDDDLFADLGRYADPAALPFRRAVAARFGVDASWVFAGNGSDEVLAFFFLACFGPRDPVCFPDITYGFYRTYCDAFGVPCREIPLKRDFSLDVDAFCAASEHVVIANPNAPTGLAVSPADVERICRANPRRLVIVDEAYVDFGNPTCVPLVETLDNLVVVQTFSKSRNLAGAHIGFAIARPDLVDDVRKVKMCFNPFNMSAPTMALGVAALADKDYYDACIERTVAERERTAEELARRGFTVLPSHANFVFASRAGTDASAWNASLRSQGVLCRHYSEPRIEDWLRITVGTREEMDAFLAATDAFLGGR
jgi:histidinol-phosphate aminotransferase